MASEKRASIYGYTERYVERLPDLTGKVVVDIPAGDGRSSAAFKRKGAHVKALDLYPESNQEEGVEKIFADMNDRLPLDDESADIVICQEGIEHVHNQLGLLNELNRILKPDGLLLITTPSISHARARLSMLLVESEYWKRLPASEANSIWLSEKNSSRLYFGHIYLLNANHLRVLSALSGFEVQERVATKPSASSVILGLLLYPFIALASAIALWDSQRKERHHLNQEKRRVMREQVQVNLSPVTLFCKDMFWVLRKRRDQAAMVEYLKGMQR